MKSLRKDVLSLNFIPFEDIIPTLAASLHRDNFLWAVHLRIVRGREVTTPRLATWDSNL